VSVSHHVYVGTFLEMLPTELSTKVEVTGCPKCKNSQQGKFCSQCGTKITTYSEEITIDDVWELSNLAEEDGIISEKFYDIYNIENKVIMPNHSVIFGDSLNLDYDSFAMDIPPPHEDNARIYYAKAISVLDHYGVKYNLRYGITYHAS
jgi:hypothetical protein